MANKKRFSPEMGKNRPFYKLKEYERPEKISR